MVRRVIAALAFCNLVLAVLACYDLPGWSDGGGDTCAGYVDEAWCSSDRGYGAGWEASWGSFEDYAREGLTAVAACCGCGGGLRNESNASDCDQTQWRDAKGFSCQDYLELAWCSGGWLKERGTYQDQADAGGVDAIAACCSCSVNGSLDNSWFDATGRNCEIYNNEKWCLDGGYGPSWKVSDGTFADWLNPFDNRSAQEACCGCGGPCTLLKSCRSSVTLRSQADVEAFAATGCQTVPGELIITGKVSDLRPL
ncbi:unnamed protein product, partial [Effrenium voratum]